MSISDLIKSAGFRFSFAFQLPVRLMRKIAGHEELALSLSLSPFLFFARARALNREALLSSVELLSRMRTVSFLAPLVVVGEEKTDCVVPSLLFDEDAACGLLAWRKTSIELGVRTTLDPSVRVGRSGKHLGYLSGLVSLSANSFASAARKHKRFTRNNASYVYVNGGWPSS